MLSRVRAPALAVASSLPRTIHRQINARPALIGHRKLRGSNPPCITTAATTPTAAAAAAASATEAAFVRVATGVPLVDVFKSMPILEAAALSAAMLLATTAFVLLSNRLVVFLGMKLSNYIETDGDRHSSTEHLISDAIRALERPTTVLLPFFGTIFSSTILASFGEVAIDKLGMADTIGRAWCSNAVSILMYLAQLLQDTSEVVVIVFFAWTWLAFKQRLVDRIMSRAGAKVGKVPLQEKDDLARIVYPISTLITWATVVATSMVSLHTVGFNVRPLLALGSVSTLAIGIAAQSTVANVVSALSLYASRPFIAGDRITLKTMSGASVISGTVEKIMPIQTILRTDAGTPIFIHNKDIATTLLVVNDSRLNKSGVNPALPTLDTTLIVRYQDVDKVAAIQEEATQKLRAHPDVIPGGSTRCALQGFDLYGAVMSVKATLKRDADSRKAVVFMQLLLAVEKTVRENGAYLAVEEGVMLPPAVTAVE